LGPLGGERFPSMRNPARAVLQAMEGERALGWQIEWLGSEVLRRWQRLETAFGSCPGSGCNVGRAARLKPGAFGWDNETNYIGSGLSDKRLASA